MANPLKLVLATYNDSSSFNISTLLLPDLSDKQNNFGGIDEQYTTLPFGSTAVDPNNPQSTWTPSITWDSANGLILITVLRKDRAIGVLTLRSGRIIGDFCWVSDQIGEIGVGEQGRYPPSLIIYNNAPLLAFRQPNGGVAISRKGPTWSSDGIWQIKGVLNNLGQAYPYPGPPCLCRVGSDWVYLFGFDIFTSTLNIYYWIIDADGLSKYWTSSSSKTQVAWNPYYSETSLSDSLSTSETYIFDPSVVVTGSPASRTIHVFGSTSQNRVIYTRIPLKPNGLPAQSAQDSTTTKGTVMFSQVVGSASQGTVTALVQNAFLYVFCIGPQPAAAPNPFIACWWRPVDGDSTVRWTRETMPLMPVSRDLVTGGFSALFVQRDF